MFHVFHWINISLLQKNSWRFLSKEFNSLASCLNFVNWGGMEWSFYNIWWISLICTTLILISLSYCIFNATKSYIWVNSFFHCSLIHFFSALNGFSIMPILSSFYFISFCTSTDLSIVSEAYAPVNWVSFPNSSIGTVEEPLHKTSKEVAFPGTNV